MDRRSPAHRADLRSARWLGRETGHSRACSMIGRYDVYSAVYRW
ncbi:MAG: hypothetical protein AB7I48_07330 [Planctomycetaceae bacterium]